MATRSLVARALRLPAVSPARSLPLAAARAAGRTSSKRWLSASSSSTERVRPPKVDVFFVAPDGDTEKCTAREGDSILDCAHDNDIEIEGACGGEMACSTCHVILEKHIFDDLPKPQEEEEDMLDLAVGLTPTSRLGCQVKITKKMEGMRIKLPWEVANMQSG